MQTQLSKVTATCFPGIYVYITYIPSNRAKNRAAGIPAARLHLPVYREMVHKYIFIKYSAGNRQQPALTSVA